MISTPKKTDVARHFINKCRDPQNPHAYLKIQPIEQVSVKEESKSMIPFGTENHS